MTAQMIRVADVHELEAKQRMLVRVDGKQIALFGTDSGVFACNNRCPHEGYPLIEGSLADDCVLTCNWHNWKFDLNDGGNLTGGDHLRCYPVELRDGGIWLDLADAPAEQRIETALRNLHESFPRHEYDRMARELARLQQAGGDPLDAVRAAFAWTYDQFEYGATHAQGAAADWLGLRTLYADDPAHDLVPVLEVIGHIAWDTRREPRFPFAEGMEDFATDAFVTSVEQEDEDRAVRMLRGGLAAGLGFADFEPALTRAALAHYQDFGHSLIYVLKTGQLLQHLGPQSAEPLLLSLTRALINARREDLIPEFRHYGTALAAWTGSGREVISDGALQRPSVKRALDLVVSASGDIPALYDALLGAAAWQLLHFDLSVQSQTDNTVAQNINWLDFTHAITFANAVRHQCSRFPDLWPQGLLQMACFLGRNGPFVDAALDDQAWRVDDIPQFLDATRRSLFDHGQFEFIVSCHLVKLSCAVADEIDAAPDAPWRDDLAAALNRFLNSPLKRKHTLRTAKQSLSFVAKDG